MLPGLIMFFIGLAGLFALAIYRKPLIAWAAAVAGYTLALQLGLGQGTLHPPVFPWWAWAGWALAAFLFALTFDPVRRALITQPAYRTLRRALPKISDTEREALQAGTTGWDAELFSGTPDWDRLRDLPGVELTAEERAFLDGPTEELCRRIDDWKIRRELFDLPEDIWRFIAEQGFLGMLISKDHGGLGFSPQAQSLVIGKISSRSADAGVVVMVPNSLGPGELIEKFGTEEQQSHFLPRLARGEEIPCFALTGPFSGSDAAAMRDIGIVAMGEHEGRETLGIRVTWDKRYITLAPKATLLGLAFRLRDPENLLGKGEDIGITLGLIPTNHPGVEIGRRHAPTGCAFPNGPTSGKDVFIPIDWIIGGADGAGRGWPMLMSCLAAGRSISLPAVSAAAAKSMLLHTTAYARIRRQFGLPIGYMEGIEAPLAELTETAYTLEAARGVTAAMVTQGEKPAVISALLKYASTERMRKALEAAMDIHGGRGICDGPSNYLQSAYQMMPIGITVEGANILTRTLIVFAQGSIRSHPYLLTEIEAVQDDDREAGFARFESAFHAHLSFMLSNLFGAAFHNLTFGIFADSPGDAGLTKRWYRQLSRGSRSFALVADMTAALLGGGLKKHQRTAGRLADALTELYMLSCLIKRFEEDGYQPDDLPLFEYSAAATLHRFDLAMDEALADFPMAGAGPVLRQLVFPFGIRRNAPSDARAKQIVRAVLQPGRLRDRLTGGIFKTEDPAYPTGLLEKAFHAVIANEPAERRLEAAIRKGEIVRNYETDWIADAEAKGIVTADEARSLKETEELVARAIAVDHFEASALVPAARGGVADTENDATHQYAAE
ncbi:MAG: acyl-CoA dehydrogenase [Methyloligella sp. ZOD6]